MTKKLHRFIGPYQIGQGTMRLDDAELAHQMRSVLKLQPGETVIIGDGSGNEAQARILGIQGDAVLLEGLAVGRNPNEPVVKATLYCAVLKADHFERAVAGATEAGISAIVPIVTSRTVKMNLRPDRIRRIVKEAAELAGRGLVPDVRDTATLDGVLTEASRNDANFFFDPSGKQLAGPAKSVRSAGLFIGPEGGWDEREIAKAADYGMRVVSLGGRILRAETAVIIATYLVAGRPNP